MPVIGLTVHTWNVVYASSSLVIPTIIIICGVGGTGSTRLPFTQEIMGSNPIRRTNMIIKGLEQCLLSKSSLFNAV